MTPRKSHWVLSVVALTVLCLLLATPMARAAQQHGGIGPFNPGGDCIVDPPQGGPTGTGGGDGGDPDDYSNLYRAPNDPGIEIVSDQPASRVNTPGLAVWDDPFITAVMIWLGIVR